MKRRMNIALFFFLFMLTVVFSSAYVMYQSYQTIMNKIAKTEYLLENNPDAIENTVSNDVNQAYEYLIRYENDKVMVYLKDGSTVYEETDIDSSRLSEETKQQLKEGIPVADVETLYSLLESYSS